MNHYAEKEDELFPIEDTPDLLKKFPELVEALSPFRHLHALWDFWDSLSKGPSATTIQCREALRRDLAEMGISD